MDKRDLMQAYEEAVGHPPRRDESDLAWQWDYVGRSDEDKQRLAEIAPKQEETEQESLF